MKHFLAVSAAMFGIVVTVAAAALSVSSLPFEFDLGHVLIRRQPSGRKNNGKSQHEDISHSRSRSPSPRAETPSSRAKSSSSESRQGGHVSSDPWTSRESSKSSSSVSGESLSRDKPENARILAQLGSGSSTRPFPVPLSRDLPSKPPNSALKDGARSQFVFKVPKPRQMLPTLARDNTNSFRATNRRDRSMHRSEFPPQLPRTAPDLAHHALVQQLRFPQPSFWQGTSVVQGMSAASRKAMADALEFPHPESLTLPTSAKLAMYNALISPQDPRSHLGSERGGTSHELPSQSSSESMSSFGSRSRPVFDPYADQNNEKRRKTG